MIHKQPSIVVPLGDPDLPTAVAVIRRAFTTVAAEYRLTPDNCSGNGAFITEARLRHSLRGEARLFGLIADDTLVGCIIAKKGKREMWYLEKAAVLPECRQRGYGRQLLGHAEHYIKEMGGKYVRIGIIGSNDALRRWYEKSGFTVTEYKEFTTLPFPVCYMEKRLDALEYPLCPQ